MIGIPVTRQQASASVSPAAFPGEKFASRLEMYAMHMYSRSMGAVCIAAPRASKLPAGAADASWNR